MTFINATRPVVCNRTPILSTLAHHYDVWRQRQALKSLDAYALRDIGLTPKEAHAESQRPFWNAPATWRC